MSVDKTGFDSDYGGHLPDCAYIEQARRENERKLRKAAEKTAKSGDRRDLREYLRLRRILL